MHMHDAIVLSAFACRRLHCHQLTAVFVVCSLNGVLARSLRWYGYCRHMPTYYVIVIVIGFKLWAGL